MGSHGVMHNQDGRLDVHDVVLVRGKKKPVVEKGQLRIGGGNLEKKLISNVIHLTEKSEKKITLFSDQPQFQGNEDIDNFFT